MQKEGRELPLFPNETEAVAKPHPFKKLFRRAGEKQGLYLSETKNRFVVSDGQREVLGLFFVVLCLAVVLILWIIGRAVEVWPLFYVSGIICVAMFCAPFFMIRMTTIFNRKTRRMIFEVTRGLWFTVRNEYDLDDVLRVKKEGTGKKARIVVDLSSEEEIPVTLYGLYGVNELKTIGPNRMNNFLKRIRGETKPKFPPSYVMSRGPWKSEVEGDLNFEANSVIKVMEASESGWWKGKLADGSSGLFPVNYTMDMAPSELAASASNSSNSSNDIA